MHLRGRVFATMESVTWSVMLISMTLAGIGCEYWNPRTIGAVVGVLSSSTALFWGWAHFTGRLPEPERLGVETGRNRGSIQSRRRESSGAWEPRC